MYYNEGICTTCTCTCSTNIQTIGVQYTSKRVANTVYRLPVVMLIVCQFSCLSVPVNGTDKQ